MRIATPIATRKALPFLLAGCLFGLAGPSRGADADKAPDAGKAAKAPDESAKPESAKPGSPAPATHPAEGAAKALAEYRALKPPPLDQSKRGDREYVQSYIQDMKKFLADKAQKAKEFADQYPDDPQTPKVLMERWNALGQVGEFKPILEETEKALKAHPDSPHKSDLLMLRAVAAVRSEEDTAAATEAVDAFIKADPKDERGAQLLMQLAQNASDPKEAAKIDRRIVEQYPDSQAAEMAKGTLQQLDAVGKPFELSFTDAVSGKPVSIKDLKGKVVVVDFWATWCGPCVGEMPHMKELYAKYKDKDVQFIGVSLDQAEAEGGLKALKDFVAENEIGWPQYYQGNGWESDFSKKWGVTSIPCVFIVDKEGRLSSTNARGRLEKLIPELLKG